jgi:lysophospholipase L1-like esterase
MQIAEEGDEPRVTDSFEQTYPLITDNSLVLFQGDSITNAGRNSRDKMDLGTGYALQVASWFNTHHPEKGVRFLNRGISGDRLEDMSSRWKTYSLDLKPNWISILIGVNDTWSRYLYGEITTTERFEEIYRQLLADTVEKLGCRLILCEPFVVPLYPELSRWREDLEPKIEVIRKLADQFQAVLVPLDVVFRQAVLEKEPSYWSSDGVHPTSAGHTLIAQTWLKAVQAEM